MATLVELIDGKIVQSDAETWRHETEARELLRMPLEKRRTWLADISRIRGAAAADALRATMTALWEKGKGG